MTYQDVSPLCCPVSMFFWTGWGVVTSYRIMILLVEVQSQIFLLQAAGERAYENTIELDVDSAFQIEG